MQQRHLLIYKPEKRTHYYNDFEEYNKYSVNDYDDYDNYKNDEDNTGYDNDSYNIDDNRYYYMRKKDIKSNNNNSRSNVVESKFEEIHKPEKKIKET